MTPGRKTTGKDEARNSRSPGAQDRQAITAAGVVRRICVKRARSRSVQLGGAT